MRRAARTDDNQTAIVLALRKAGCKVHVTSGLGGGFPDVVARHPRVGVRLLEIKDGSRPPCERRLTPAEERFAAAWSSVWRKVESEREALAAMGLV
jgi:hypothetical protein